MGGNWIGMREYTFLYIPLKSQIFIPAKLWKIGGNRIRFNDFLIKTPKIPLHIQPFILKYEYNSNIVIKWFYFIPLCYSLTKLLIFHLFSFPSILYFKTSKQDYLITFHFFLLHSFLLLKYISFNFIPLWLFYYILFHFLINSQTKP